MNMPNPIRRIRISAKAAKSEINDMLFMRKRSVKVPVAILNKLRMWRLGFLSQSYLIYDLQHNDCTDYVSDHARLKQVVKFNGYYSVILYDKLYFTKILDSFTHYLPKTHALIKDRRITFFHRARSEGIDAIVELSRAEGTILLKPSAGSHGAGVIIVTSANGKITINGREASNEDLLSTAANLDDYLVTEFVSQHDYAATIFPRATNTIRIMTLWDDQTNQPFIAAAVHRFGNSKTLPVDSWTRGGIGARIDLDTGALGKAAPKPLRTMPSFTPDHPETRIRIEGVIVPHWDLIKAAILKMAAAMPFVPYIGWDLIVTQDGFKVIEGNNNPDILMFQIHAPLLANPRVRRFYERHIARLNAAAQTPRRYKLPFKI